MAHPASRVLAMLELLQAHRHLTGRDLATRLGVDERTVRRYAGTLAGLDIPVVAERGRYGGYRLLPGFKLPPLMFTDEEAVAVVLGLAAAGHLGLAAQTPALALAEAKIARVLPRPLAERLGALRDSLGFTGRPRRPTADRPGASPSGRVGPAEPGDVVADRPGAPGVPEAATLLTLGTATRARQRVTLSYRSREERTSQRELDPYGLVFHSGRWYVVGHDHTSAEVRSFRVDRIGAVAATAVPFEPPAGFDAVAHVTRQWAALPWTHEVEVLIEADPAAVGRRIPPVVAHLTPAPDGVLLRCRANDLGGMARLLAGLDAPFTVIRPDELRERLAEHAARLTHYAARRPA